jgi:hypothetical protein
MGAAHALGHDTTRHLRATTSGSKNFGWTWELLFRDTVVGESARMSPWYRLEN